MRRIHETHEYKRDKDMKIVGVSYGRTVVLEGRRFSQDKVWFGWEAEVQEGDDPDDCMKVLQARAEQLEMEEKRRAYRRRED